MVFLHLPPHHAGNMELHFLNKILHEFLLPLMYDTRRTLPNFPNFIIPV